ncbi:MAG: hypothetical protein ABW149_15315, partial [Sedimenticola sp.]
LGIQAVAAGRPEHDYQDNLSIITRRQDKDFAINQKKPRNHEITGLFGREPRWAPGILQPW